MSLGVVVVVVASEAIKHSQISEDAFNVSTQVLDVCLCAIGR